MKIVQLYQDHGIRYADEQHRHARPGWVNTECPFCVGNPGYHLGYNLEADYYYCWRCGSHSINETLKELLHLKPGELTQILQQYEGIAVGHTPIVKVNQKPLKLPPVEPLTKRHHNYLQDRRFDSHKLEREWGLVGTGPLAKLDDTDYKHRVIAPIAWDGQMVSFQGRDITDKHRLKYLTCNKEREIIHHKHILYGKQQDWQITGICVEGITDVWRLGRNSFCTFGIQYTPQQLRCIAKHFKRVAIVFDSESQAQRKAHQMKNDLLFRGVDAWVEVVEGDPALMKQREANDFVKYIMNKKIL